MARKAWVRWSASSLSPNVRPRTKASGHAFIGNWQPREQKSSTRGVERRSQESQCKDVWLKLTTKSDYLLDLEDPSSEKSHEKWSQGDKGRKILHEQPLPVDSEFAGLSCTFGMSVLWHQEEAFFSHTSALTEKSWGERCEAQMGTGREWPLSGTCVNSIRVHWELVSTMAAPRRDQKD